MKTSLQSETGCPTRRNHRVTGDFAYLQRTNMLKQHVWSMIMTLCGTQCWMAERGKAAIIRKKRTMQQCLITTLSHGGVATIERADFHFSESKVKQCRLVWMLRPSETHLGFILTPMFISLFCSHSIFMLTFALFFRHTMPTKTQNGQYDQLFFIYSAITNYLWQIKYI